MERDASLSAGARWTRHLTPFVQLSINPVSLFCGLLLINAIAQPYSDLIHDARLYAVQVLNRVDPGMYADDLFLKYGSQDKFSLFSQTVAPFAREFGLRPTFLGFYLISIGILLLGAQRFMATLTHHHVVAAAALVYLAVNPIAFGGVQVFHVNETFLTPRLAAIGLVLFGMERLARDRRIQSLVIFLAAMLLHPIMAFPGCLVWLYCTLFQLLNHRRFIILVASTLVAALIALWVKPIGLFLFGEMDETWRQHVADRTYGWARPHEWFLRDWLAIGLAFIITYVGRRRLRLPDSTTHLLDAIMFISGVGLVVGFLAPFLPYSLLIQGQPYRAVWIIQLTQIPIGAALIYQAWSTNNERTQSICILFCGLFAMNALTFYQLASLLTLLATISLIAKGYEPKKRLSLLLKIVFVLAIIASVVSLLYPLIEFWPQLERHASSVDILRFIGPTLGPVYLFILSVIFLNWLQRRSGEGRRFQMMALISCLAVQCFFLSAPKIQALGGSHAVHEDRLMKMHSFVHAKFDSKDAIPTVYWPQAPLEDITVALRSKCFFSTSQTAGSMFNRETAIEGNRRANLVSRFEHEAIRRVKNLHEKQDWKKQSLLKIFGNQIDNRPTWEDFHNLCQEEIDFVVLRINFGNLHSEKFGPFYVYECDKISDVIAQQIKLDNRLPVSFASTVPHAPQSGTSASEEIQ